MLVRQMEVGRGVWTFWLFELSCIVISGRRELIWYVVDLYGIWLFRVVMDMWYAGPHYVPPSLRRKGRWLVPVPRILPSQS
jgi:hypothetical protein